MPAVSSTLDLNLELLDGAAVSLGVSTNLEQLNGAPHSLLVNPNIELQNGTDVSTTKAVNLQIIDALAIAGSPDSILNLPPFATSSRMRADFFKWESDNPASLSPENEYIGAKVGSAPLLSVTNFQYTARLSAVGDWSMTVPLADDKLQCIYDGTAQIIKVYYENVGCIFIGWVSGYNVSSTESLEIYGYDLMILLQRAKSLWRIVIWKLIAGFSTRSAISAPWYYSFMRLIQVWCNILEAQFETLSNRPTFDRDNLRSFFPTYQDQSVLEIARDLGEISGNSFRIEPATGILTFGLFGDDSGIILSEFRQDEVEVREQGGLQITNVTYSKDEEELVNFLVPQGSNDSFGVAVELRHTSGSAGTTDTRRFVHNNRYVDSVKLPPGNPKLWDDNPLVQKRAGSEYLLVVGEHFRYGYTGHFATDYGLSFEAQTRFSVTTWRENSDFFFSFTPSTDFYLTFVSFLNLGGVGDPQFYFRGGAYPDWIRFQQTSWDTVRPGYATLPGYEPEWPFYVFTGQQGQVNQDHQIKYPDIDLERAPVAEALAFMNLPRLPDDPTPPWPLCEAGNTYNIRLDSRTRLFEGAGIPELLLYTAPDNERGDQVNPSSASVIGSPASDPLPRWAMDTSNNVWCEISGYPVDSVYPYAIEGMYAENAGGDDSDSGHRVFFLRDFESIRRYGLRPATVSFQTALDTLEGTNAIRPMSDLLNDMAQIYLARHKDPKEEITVTTIGAFRIPKLGQKLRVVYRGLVEVENGKFNWIDINDLYYLVEVNWSMTDEGIQHTFKLSNVPENINADLQTQSIIKSTRRSNNYMGEFQTSLNRIGRIRTRLVSRRY